MNLDRLKSHDIHFIHRDIRNAEDRSGSIYTLARPTLFAFLDPANPKIKRSEPDGINDANKIKSCFLNAFHGSFIGGRHQDVYLVNFFEHSAGYMLQHKRINRQPPESLLRCTVSNHHSIRLMYQFHKMNPFICLAGVCLLAA